MIGITTYDSSRTEPLLYIQNFEMTEELNGIFEIAFNSLNIPENVGHALIQEEAVVYVENIGFRIKQIETTPTLKRVIAVSLYFDNVVTRRKQIFGGTHTLDEFLSFLYKDTGWTYTIEGITGSKLIPNFGDGNIQELTEILLEEFNCERKIMADKHLHFAPMIGPDNSAQYRYGYNVKAITERVDSTNMFSRIEGRGADGLSVMYISPNEPQIGIREAEPFEDEEFKDAELLRQRIAREIVDYPSVSFELDTVELTGKELGERVWLIYEPLGISFQTRVLTKVSTLRNLEVITSSVVLGNMKPRTLSDILTEQKVEIVTNNKQVRSKIEQTNETIKLEVSAIGKTIEEGQTATNSKIEQTAEEIRSEVTSKVEDIDGKIEETNASITTTAEAIRSEVSSKVTEINGDIAETNSSIEQLSGVIALKADASVTTALGTRMNSVEIGLDSVNGQITQKVSQSDYNGNTIASMINQSATTVTIQASKISLVGAVNVLSDISGNLGTITAGNINISSEIQVGNAIYIGNRNAYGTVKSLYFNNSANISGGTGFAGADIEYNADVHKFVGEIDMSRTTYVNWGGNKPIAVWG